MDRLTHKGFKDTYINGLGVLVDFNDKYFPNGGVSISDLCCKLGKLEDIEQELGIGLDTLYELLVRGCYYKCDNEILYTFGDVDVSNKCICNHYNKELLFKDYGRTLAITKEELE